MDEEGRPEQYFLTQEFDDENQFYEKSLAFQKLRLNHLLSRLFIVSLFRTLAPAIKASKTATTLTNENIKIRCSLKFIFSEKYSAEVFSVSTCS